MKVYQVKYRDRKTGKEKHCRCWHLTFADSRQVRRRMSAYTNKRASEKLAANIEELLSCGGILTPDLQQWLENLPEKMREKLIAFGLIDSRRVSENLGKPLVEHLADFRNSLINTGRKERYAQQVASRIELIFAKAGFKTWGDIDGNAFLDCLAAFKGEDGIGQRSFNYYLKSTKQFCKWMLRERRATGTNPLAHLSCITQTEKRRQRRALTLDETHKLLAATENGETCYNLTGHERVLVYRLALETGLRANEIRTLTGAAFDFNGRTVTVQAGYAKNKKTATLPLKKQLADDLQFYLSGKLPSVRVFALPDSTAKMIRKDLVAAGIPYRDEGGRYSDFHSLRHSFITNLANSGVHPSVAQKLARHSTITLTMDVYSHTRVEAEVEAIENLPDLTGEKIATKRIG